MERKYKIFRFVSCLNEGSIGRTAEQLGQLVQSKGWSSFIAYSRFNLGSTSEVYRVDNKISTLFHAFITRMFDMCGYGSYFHTKLLVKKIKEYNPDLIHLHIFHNYDINIKVLFQFLAKADIPIVWTHHDCWGYTGHCAFYSKISCDKWKTGCDRCPLYKEYPSSWFFDFSSRNYNFKKKVFNLVPKKNMVMVPVSEFVKKDMEQSFLKEYPIKRIYNAIDTDMFKPLDSYSEVCEKYGIKKGSTILSGFATSWTERKGLSDYFTLRQRLPDSFVIMLVGVNDDLKNTLPEGIIGIKKTNTVQELVKLYNASKIILNLASEESFGKTTPEGLSCGVPGIVYNCTASPELVDEHTGVVVEKGDIDGVIDAISIILSWDPIQTKANCRKRVMELFDTKNNWNEYINLYESMINKHRNDKL